MQKASYAAESLEARFLAGDAVAHGQVSLWVAQIVSKSRFRMLRDEWSDLHQEVLARLVDLLRKRKFDASMDLRVYVQGVARNTMLENVRRRLRRRRDAEVDWFFQNPAASAEGTLLSRDMAHRILTAVPANCRDLFRRVFYEQRSYAEVARELGIAVGTVKSRLFRCLERARRVMAGEPEGGAGQSDG